MADIFISYAREDKDLVESLRDSLESQGLKTWVDIDGLYAGEEFWPEVTRAIDEAVVFIFVMSIHSLTSRFCREEIDHAVAGQKRLVPLCLEDPGDLPVPGAFAKRQWVLHRAEDDPEAAFASLLAAIRADWVEQRLRARVFARAREWQDRDQDPSLLVRGRELKEAADWLERAERTGGEEAESAPTELHRQFLSAAGRAVRRRRLRLSGATLAAVATVAVVTWLALEWRVKTLVNLGQGQEVEKLGDLEKATALCAAFRDSFSACPVAAYSYGIALTERDEFVAAGEQFSRAIEAQDHEFSGAEDVAVFLGNAYQMRAYAGIMLAEQQTAAPDREAAYASALRDIEKADREFSAGRDREASERLRVVRARAHLGIGKYLEALAELDRAALQVWSPQIDLLLSLGNRCSKHIEEADQHFQRYMAEILGQWEDPQWQQDKAFYRSVAERCAASS